jgi:nucleoside-diphosphate-sugar epimerase
MDARSEYGLSKAMGEMVCLRFCAGNGPSILALRLYAPSPPDVWRSTWGGTRPSGHTTFRDTARAYDLAVSLTDHTGYDALFISGDHTGEFVNCAKARDLLGWEPQDRVDSPQ